MMQDIFHSAIIHYSETHLSTSKFDDSEEIFYFITSFTIVVVLESDKVGDVELPGCLEVGF